MNKDFRVATSFFTHLKTRRLERVYGAEGVLSLIRIWAYAAQHRTKGVFYGMDEDDIADVSGWSGDSGFVSTLVEIGFLDRTDDGLAIHDWKIHNGWVFGADGRSEDARRAAHAKWAKKRGTIKKSPEPES